MASAEQRLGRIGMVSAICGTWLVQATIAYRVLRDVFGEEEVEGSPRWRCAFGTLNQLFLLPAFFLIAWFSQGSIVEWEQTRLVEQLRAARKAAHAAAERLERMASGMATEGRAAGERMAAAASAKSERMGGQGRVFFERGQAAMAEGRVAVAERRHAAAERMAGMAGAGVAACGRSVDFAERLAASGFGAAERMALKAAEQAGIQLERRLMTIWMERAFSTVFAAFLIFDILFVPASPLLVFHHAACLVCHFWAIFTRPRGFPLYFAGVVLLEVGSGCCNAFWLYHQTDLLRHVYVWGMAASNVTALLCVYFWCQLQPGHSRLPAGFATLMILCFITMRTKASLEATEFIS